MITVKLYGLLRLDSGIKERQVEAATVAQILDYLQGQGISRKDLNGAVVLVNGQSASKRTKVNDGDVVQLLSPVAGG